MSKYQVGDKVVLRKDLVVGAEYGKCIWVSAINPLADKDYVTIKDVCSFDCYKPKEADYYAISDEMIQGLYTDEEETKMKYQVGDKVIIRKDLDYLYDEELNEEYRVPELSEVTDKPYVVIEEILDRDYIVSNKAFPEEMIQGLYEEEETTYFLYRTAEVGGLSTFLTIHNLLGVARPTAAIVDLVYCVDYLLTEEEAKLSPLYPVLIKVDPKEVVDPTYTVRLGDRFVARFDGEYGPIALFTEEELVSAKERFDIVTEFTSTQADELASIVQGSTITKAN